MIFGVKLSDDEAEDSFSLIPLFEGEDRAVRKHAVSTSIRGIPAVRFREWKYIPVTGSGGWGKGGDPSQSVQLYNLATDLSETNNLAAREPQRVTQMQKLLTRIIRQGRSTPGVNQENDVKVIRHGP